MIINFVNFMHTLEQDKLYLINNSFISGDHTKPMTLKVYILRNLHSTGKPSRHEENGHDIVSLSTMFTNIKIVSS